MHKGFMQGLGFGFRVRGLSFLVGFKVLEGPLPINHEVPTTFQTHSHHNPVNDRRNYGQRKQFHSWECTPESTSKTRYIATHEIAP